MKPNIFSHQGSVKLAHEITGAQCTDVKGSWSPEAAEWSWVIRTARLVSGLSVLEGGVCHKGSDSL